MAQQCLQNEYFDSLLQACKPCRLRCSKTPPATCQGFCGTSVMGSAKGSNTVLWTCVGLGLALSLALFVLMFLIKKRKDGFQNTGSAALDPAKANLDKNGTRDEVTLPRGLGYTVEECSCEDCVRSKPMGDADHFFPLPAMEEGATILVTTKTNDYCNSMPATLESIMIEKSISSS